MWVETPRVHVTHDDRTIQRFQVGNDLTWLGTSGDDITQAHDAINVFCFEIVQDSF